MTIRQALQLGARALGGAATPGVATPGVDTPVLDTTVLLSHALGVSKERLLADLPEELDPSVEQVFRGYLEQRLAGLPVSYIRGFKEFYGLELYVDPRVLVPRPDTETLVEHVLGLLREIPGTAALHDACTGTGCVAIALSVSARVDASVSDISPGALEVCRANALRHLGRELPAVVSDLLDSVAGAYDIITANPPYLRDGEVKAMREAGWPEPELALAGGPEGTRYVGRLVETAPERLRAEGWLVLECAPWQAAPLGVSMRERGYREVTVTRDLGGRERVVSARRPG